ncbi:PEP/pyruvate-binding domain-containing protein [Methanolobus mangrovi]|uniref:PEP/pyruvate-binding domain-containing protein n=1 Tax=Methanolobus mangrovi TaxID=3072977 RepID=A0AA51UHB4_9EURY|nr:PEP/pyruvate-binding domain-containing protein [Methanolobus mangrovi]WMW22973.1 PEP/pyruvate-binding domain-containing protein [Methanolobus mangrovi]
MKELVISMEGINEKHREFIGSKAFSLHTLHDEGLKVPPYTCITTKAYEKYLRSSSLKGRITLELARKDIKDMRWEEMWDLSLRIRNFFLNTPIPETLEKEIRDKLDKYLTDVPVVVRSSAPGEDTGSTSFAGLHESYVNIRGLEAIIKHIRLVWASLWSDAAFLYREELGLDIKDSSMAVMIQELIAGEVSGIVFSSNPENKDQMVIEAVHGLNKGLVDGDVEPDRWILDRENSSIIQHTSPSNRERITLLKNTGTALEKPSDKISNTVPLSEREVHELYDIALVLEKRFGNPQDIEWTKKDNETYILQSRPITTTDDREKLWYLSLKRTMANLQKLRIRIENELIPEMVSDTNAMRSVKLENMDNIGLAREIMRRKELYEMWEKRYKDEFIPFAHGMRLFGQVYNDVVKPDNPYEFMDLLSSAGLLSIKRNGLLSRLAGMLRNDVSLMNNAKNNLIEGDFKDDFEEFFENYGHSGIFKSREELLKLIMEIASNPEKEMPAKKDTTDMEKHFIASFSEKDRACAEELLDVGRISYRLRDDDNIHLGRIEDQYLQSLNEAKHRVVSRSFSIDTGDILDDDELLKSLNDETYIPVKKPDVKKETLNNKEYQRQIQGQPAGEGLVTGIAHVITGNEELFNIKFGEILVCDAIDPNMTFVVPLVSGIVERRGGMLIHGAIIAREYGIPCVTGIPDATQIIRNGDEVTVDGYLGIVTIRRKSGTG